MSLSSQVRRQLQGMAEPGYAAFSASLIPGVQAMLGVRLPRLRALAARLRGPCPRAGSAADRRGSAAPGDPPDAAAEGAGFQTGAARRPRPLAEPSGSPGGNRRERSQRLWKNCVKGLDFCGNID